VVSISQERDDYLRTPGRRANLYIGPFEFYLSTADEGWLNFTISIRGWFRVGWNWQGMAR